MSDITSGIRINALDGIDSATASDNDYLPLDTATGTKKITFKEFKKKVLGKTIPDKAVFSDNILKFYHTKETGETSDTFLFQVDLSSISSGGGSGQDGVGISNIAKTGTSGLVDTYTITLTDNSTYTFTVTNGKDGASASTPTLKKLTINGVEYDGTEEVNITIDSSGASIAVDNTLSSTSLNPIANKAVTEEFNNVRQEIPGTATGTEAGTMYPNSSYFLIGTDGKLSPKILEELNDDTTSVKFATSKAIVDYVKAKSESKADQNQGIANAGKCWAVAENGDLTFMDVSTGIIDDQETWEELPLTILDNWINKDGTENTYNGTTYGHVAIDVSPGEKYKIKSRAGSNVYPYLIIDSNGNVIKTSPTDGDSFGTYYDYTLEIIVAEKSTLIVNTVSRDYIGIKKSSKSTYAKINYNTAVEMIEDSKLEVGNICSTTGYYDVKDSGGAIYIISDVAETFAITLSNGLYANIVIGKSVYLKQLGVRDGDDIAKICESTNVDLLGSGENVTCSACNLKKSIIGPMNITIIDDDDRSSEYTVMVKGDEISFRDLNITAGTGAKGYWFRIQETKNLVIENIHCTSVDEMYCNPFDLYGENRNAIIRNIYFDFLDGILLTPILVRNYAGTLTENVIIENCWFNKGGNDEAIWLDSTWGTVRNISIRNNIFYTESTVNNTLWVGASREGGLMENVVIENNTFMSNSASDRLIKVARYSAVNDEVGITRGVTIRDNLFKGNVANYVIDCSDKKACIVTNNTFNINSKYILNNVKSQNNIFNCDTGIIFQDCDSMNDDVYAGEFLAKDSCSFKNLTANVNGLKNSSDAIDVIFIDSKIDTRADYFAVIGKYESTIRLINCEVSYQNFIQNNSVDNALYLILKDMDMPTANLMNNSNNSSITLINVTRNGSIFNSDLEPKEAMIDGTVLYQKNSSNPMMVKVDGTFQNVKGESTQITDADVDEAWNEVFGGVS